MATQNKTLTTVWQLLKAAPVVVALETGKVAELHSAASAPAVDAPPQRLVRGTDRESRTFNGSNNIYARKPANAGETVVSFDE
jgi:hypothetical protein